ncbi:glycosyltransferase [Paenibacillus larvae]|uniref:glycosyltransferase family 2 protein n=1 Tax=Paenibacillus larvae TaxID=1464 RepID=UPI0028919BB0|nr:glycosyltransferase [Paenibacillus larvae]MDT2197099.1 glycosyltransferase [Paenibacillus larvae]
MNQGGMKQDLDLLQDVMQEEFRPEVSVILPVYNESRTLPGVLQGIFGLHPSMEVIVVANGSTDGTRKLAEDMGATVLWYPEPLGHDVGRSVGASYAKGNVLLFIDGDIVIPSKELVPFIKAVFSGVDIALNKYKGLTHQHRVHDVVLAKHALSIVMSRQDLLGTSMTAIPHALSRRAVETLGTECLAVPPKALALAVLKGLRVEPVHYVRVGANNPRRRREHGPDPLTGLIVGDHLEALHEWIKYTDMRGGFTDHMRQRHLVR